MGSETLPEMAYKYLKNKTALAEQSDEIDGGQERTDRRNRRVDLAAERREKRGTEPPLLFCGGLDFGGGGLARQERRRRRRRRRGRVIPSRSRGLLGAGKDGRPLAISSVLPAAEKTR
jgi:hypothetical protein